MSALQPVKEPESLDRSTSTVAALPISNSWGWFPVLTLTSAAGLFLVALAYDIGRLTEQEFEPLFWFGLLVIFLPIAWRLFSPLPSRRERIALLIVLGLTFYFVKYLKYPLYFSGFDEFTHWRTAQDTIASGHLFQDNPLLQISSFYPGLEIVTTALSSLTGLSLFISGMVIIGVANLMFVLALYLFYECLCNAARVAGIATLLYIANPGFLFFDQTFAYESFALPLSIFVVFALTFRWRRTVGGQRGLTLAIWLGIGAVIITHHITSIALVAFLLLWTVLSLLPRHNQNGPRDASLVGIMLLTAWSVYTGYIVLEYLAPHLTSTMSQVVQILTGKGTPRQLFHGGAGYVTPLWERVMGYASVLLILLTLPFGFRQIWRRHRTSAAALALAGGALAYPLSQALRLTAAGAESGMRAVEFLFVGIAFVLALGATEFWLTRTPGWRRSLLILGAVAVIFVGQEILSAVPSWGRLPGSFLVSADERSISPEGITAAEWAGLYLGPGRRIGTDRVNSILMGTYGYEDVLTATSEQASVAPLFTSLQLEPPELAIVGQDRLQYLVVDLRLSMGLPEVGTYFEAPSSGKNITQPINLAALTKFDGMKEVDRVFDSGNIIIYNIEAITNGGSP